jgi:hypothetical protein
MLEPTSCVARFVCAEAIALAMVDLCEVLRAV